MTEQLTDEERESLIRARCDGSGVKALRIIDAHAAGVAELVAQLEAAERDRDVWRRRSHAGEGPELEQAQAALAAVRAERERLLDALADVDPPSKALFKRAEAAEAQVAELTQERNEVHTRADHNAEAAQNWHAEVTRLTRERDVAVSDHDAIHEELRDAKSEVTRLTEALEAAERRTRTELARVDAAEARVRELETWGNDLHAQWTKAESECAALRAEVERLRRDALNEAGHAIASEDRLAAANALLERWKNPDPFVFAETCAHLAAQPATAPARPPFPPRGIQGRPELTEEYADDAAESGDDLAGALDCCRAWASDARLIGNVRASTLLRLLERTEAEQAVLKATANTIGLPIEYLRHVEKDPNQCWAQTARAELARRGLKP